MKKFDFIKMHGLGNDFVIIDERNGELGLSTAEIVSIDIQELVVTSSLRLVMILSQIFLFAFSIQAVKKFPLVVTDQGVLQEFLWRKIKILKS